MMTLLLILKKKMNYRVKRESNDSLRQRFVDVTVPQAEFLGLKVPDKNLKMERRKQDIMILAIYLGMNLMKSKRKQTVQ